MKFETLKQNKRKKFIIGLVVLVAVISTLSLVGSRAKYRTTDSIPLVNGTINYKPNDLNLVAVNIENDNGEYIYSEDIPTSGYYLDDSKSYCEVKGVKDNSILIQYSNNKLEVSDIIKKGTRCYAYFNKTESKTCPSGASACETIMANANTIGERTDFSKIVTATTTGVMYKAEDDYGTSYYYAGDATDNFITFGGFYWRIIRINGNGSVRVIYYGKDCDMLFCSDKYIARSAFNSSYNDNMYVGYMYTSGQIHGTGTSSTIKEVLDSWYINNLESYANYIDTNIGFCGDRRNSTIEGIIPDETGGTGTTTTFYATFYRLAYANAPTFKCVNSSDLYTSSISNTGNKALSYPIGLITMDEVAYAGGKYGITNSSYYLNISFPYWTISPFGYKNGTHCMFVEWSGAITHWHVNNPYSVRPVINLKSDVSLTGSGTSTDPYVVS